MILQIGVVPGWHLCTEIAWSNVQHYVFLLRTFVLTANLPFQRRPTWRSRRGTSRGEWTAWAGRWSRTHRTRSAGSRGSRQFHPSAAARRNVCRDHRLEMWQHEINRSQWCGGLIITSENGRNPLQLLKAESVGVGLIFPLFFTNKLIDLDKQVK